MRRREFLRGAGLAGVAAAGRLGMAQGQLIDTHRRTFEDGTATGGAEFNVREMGAAGDGIVKDTVALQAAIDRCGVFGGGQVMVPEGTYLTGGLALRSGVTLRLDEGAVIKGSADFADYPVGQVRWEGKWIPGHLGLIHARDAERIGIMGKGRIEGAHELGGRPTKEMPLRHPCLIEPIGCKEVRLEGFVTDYFRMWSLHPTNCEDVTIRGLTIRSTGGNGDGIDVDSCRRVRIDGCDIATGDDCISIKSGRGSEGYKLLRTSSDIEITNCTFADSIFACIGIGSETSGGIRGVTVKRCKFTGAKTFAVYIKSRPGRGAFIEDLTFEDLDVTGEYGGGFLRFNMTNSGIQDEVPVEGLEGVPTVRNWRFSNIRVQDVPVLVDGASVTTEKPLEGLVLEKITGICGKGITLANVRGARIKDVTVTVRDGKLLNLTNVQGTGFEQAGR